MACRRLARRALALAALLCAGAAAGCGPDGRQVRLCQRVLAELEDSAAGLARVGAESLPPDTPGVALLLQAKAAPAGAAPRRFVCLFRGARFDPGQSELVGVIRLSGEPVSDFALRHLRLRVGLR